jgi:hypothetical protein
MKQVIAGYAMLVLSIIGIVSITTIAVVIVIEYRSADVIEQSIVKPEALTQAQANMIRQAQVQSGNQAIITCENGLVYVDNGIGGLVWGEVMKVKWESPVINQPDMVKTLYCLNGSIRTE